MGKVGDSVSVNNTNRAETKVNDAPKTEVKNQTTTAPLKDDSNIGATSKLGELNNFGNKIKDKLNGFFGDTPPASNFSKEATVTKTGGEVIIDSGAGDDQIGVSQDPKTGDITVTVNGERQTFSGSDRDNLVIRAGDGNDNIWVDENVTVHLRLEGQNGDDFIRGGGGNDKIEGGDGNDRLHGSGGDDYINGSKGEDIIYGDTGNDVVYGGDDNDKLYGNDGNDYLEGSKGNDEIYGNDGNDVVSGGIGDDYLRGNYGDDAIYAGQGTDEIFGDDGVNQIYAQTDDTVQKSEGTVRNTVVTVELTGNPGSTSVIINGSDEFRERVEADLEMLRSSPVGRQMLEGYDEAFTNDNVTVTINESSADSGSADWANRLNPTAPQPFYDPATGTTGTPNSAEINYNPSYMPTYTYSDGTSTESIPTVVLFHEMAHAYDFTHGTFRNEAYNGTDNIDNGSGLRTGERVAVGLPIDNDANAATTEQTDDAVHPDELTENGLREEMNLQQRLHYIGTGKSRV